MNTSYKCNCCCKEDVCKYKEQYLQDCERIKSQIVKGGITEVSIKCTKFISYTQNRDCGNDWFGTGRTHNE